MAKPKRTYLLRSERHNCYRDGVKVAEPQIGGKPIPLKDFQTEEVVEETTEEEVVEETTEEEVVEETTEEEIEEEEIEDAAEIVEDDESKTKSTTKKSSK